MRDSRGYPWWYQEWYPWNDSYTNPELGLFAWLRMWVDDGRIQALLCAEEGGTILFRESFVVGHLETAAIYELLDALHWMVEDCTNKNIADVLVPAEEPPVRSWLLSLMAPDNRQWAIAALVASGLKGFKVCSLKDALRAVFWGAAERAALCEQLDVSEAEFKGAHKVACKAASALIEAAGESASVEWFADWACSK